jgi:hypothetical protein
VTHLLDALNQSGNVHPVDKGPYFIHPVLKSPVKTIGVFPERPFVVGIAMDACSVINLPDPFFR